MLPLRVGHSKDWPWTEQLHLESGMHLDANGHRLNSNLVSNNYGMSPSLTFIISLSLALD